MISLRTRIIIGVLAVGSALLAVLGDDFFKALGAPPKSGRAIVAVFLLIVGIAYVAWTMLQQRADDAKSAAARRNRTTRS